MANENSLDSEQARYWNEGGGRRWAANIARVERMLQPLADRVLALAAPERGERVIDVGCGGGLTSKALADAVGANGEVMGLDVSTVILDVARQRYRDVSQLRFVHGDAGSMPFAHNLYSLVTSRFGVMFFPDSHGAFAHLRTALAPDGRLAFICWRELALNPWMAVPVKAAFEILPRPEPLAPRAPGPFAFAERDYLYDILSTAGFAQIEITAHDQSLDLGTVSDAVEQMTRMGPSAPAYDEATPAVRAQLVAALTEVFQPFVTNGTVQMPSATWLVRATRGA